MGVQGINTQKINPIINKDYNGQKLVDIKDSERLDDNFKEKRKAFEQNTTIVNTENDLNKKKETIINAIEKANSKIEVKNKGLEFSIHEATNQIMIKVIDKDTKEVVKEIPSEKILDMVAQMMELAGKFIDEKR